MFKDSQMTKGEGDTYKGPDGKSYNKTGQDKYELCKSDPAVVDAEALNKSLDELLKATTDRKGSLLQKAATSEGLTTEESDELHTLLKGGASLSARVTAGLGGPETPEALRKGLEVSSFLDASNRELVKALTDVSDEVEAGGRRQHDFNVSLAKSLVNMGQVLKEQNELVKSMAQQMGAIASQPARPPKSVGIAGAPARPLVKSFQTPTGGAPAGEGEQLNKSQTMAGLEGAMLKARQSGDERLENELYKAVVKLESSGQVSPEHLNVARRHWAERSQQAQA